MFLLQQLLNRHEAKTEEWEEARDDYKKNTNYYSERDYRIEHPRPGDVIVDTSKAFFIFVIVAVTIFLLVMTVRGETNHKKTSTKDKTSKSQKQDVTFKVGDTVQVLYGDYKDSVGVIVKLGNDTAIIKLTNSTFTTAMARADGYSSSGTDNGQLLKISSMDNLVPYKEVK